MTLIWNDYGPTGSPANEAVGLGWLVVTVNANANTGLPAPVTFVLGNLPGDINGDRRVDSTDFSILAGNFGRTNLTPARGDLTADDRVSSSDFAILAGNFGKTLASPPAALVQPAARQPAAPARRVVAPQPIKTKRAARMRARGAGRLGAEE